MHQDMNESTGHFARRGISRQRQARRLELDPDVVRRYSHLEGVQIAGDADSFVAACDKALELAHGTDREWLAEADLMLASQSEGHSPGADGRPDRRRAWRAGSGKPPGNAGGCRMSADVRPAGGAKPHYDYLIVGAGFAGASLPSASPAAERAGPAHRPAARTSAAMPMTRRTPTGILFTDTARTSSTPTRKPSSTICRNSLSGARTSIACWPRSRQAGADSDQPRYAQRTLRSRPRPTRTADYFWPSRAEPVEDDQDLRGRRRQRRRPRALRIVLPAAIPASNGASTRPSSTSR